MKKLTFIVALFAFFLTAKAQTNGLISGPMLGYIEHREALIWLEVAPDVEAATIKYRIKGKPETEKEATNYAFYGNSFRTMKVVLENLDMNTEYEYDIYLNEKKVTPSVITTFKTKKLWEWREPDRKSVV